MLKIPKTRRASPKGKRRTDAKIIPTGVQKHLDELMPHLIENIPESTACALIGLDYTVWDGYCGRYPALRLAVKRAQAERLVTWQKTVEAGAQGWQAAAVLLERRDPTNWSRTQSTPRAKTSSYARAVKSRKT